MKFIDFRNQNEANVMHYKHKVSRIIAIRSIVN